MKTFEKLPILLRNRKGAICAACMLLALPSLSVLAEEVAPAQRSDRITDTDEMQKIEPNLNEGAQREAERYRMGQTDQISLSEENKEDIREVLASVVENAAAAEIEDVVDYLAANDRERLDTAEESEDATLRNQSEDFLEKWRNTHGMAFEDSFDQSALNVEFVSVEQEKTATVRLHGGEQPIMLKLVNQGTLMDDWRIDAPDTLSLQQLQQEMGQALSKISVQSNKQEIAAAILKPLSGGQA